jgi:diguanylate cyclase (GGDEF)-like protein/PAS domain S-box-containing protein
LSVAIAVIASWGALLMMYRGARVKLPTLPRFALGAIIMGSAIAGMHYTAMLGAQIQPGSLCLADATRIEPNLLALLVSLTSLFWFGGGILAALFDQRMARQNAQALAELEQTHANLLERAAEEASEMTQSLRDSEERLRMTLRCAPDAVFICEKNGRIVYVNDNVVEMLGFSRGELLCMSLFDLVPRDWRERYWEGSRQILADNERHVFEIRLVRKDGSKIPMELNSVLLPNGRVYGSCRDISERKLAERRLLESEEYSRLILDKALDAVVGIDAGGLIIEWNAEAERVFGYRREAVMGRDLAELIIPEQHRERHRAGMNRFLQTRESKMLGTRIEISALRKDGEEFPVELSVVPVQRGEEIFFSGFLRDITERKQAEQQIHQLAFYDVLTRLPNRRLLMDRLQQAFSVSARNGQHGAVMFLDLDHFKTLNDTKGHDIGDLLLLEDAKRLESCVRDGDTVARLGGDEFVIVLETLSTITDEAVTQAERVAEKIHATLNQPYRLKEHTHHTTPSIGIVLFRGHQESIDELLKHADTAMYQAKTAGRNAIRFYDPLMQAALEARIELEAELRQALEKQQFRLHYQIQVDSQRRPLGAEVLLRWEHPERGLVSPAQFIPLAEETGLIVPIGQWVLQVACVQLELWHHDPQMRDMTLAVNVSAKQFRQPDFVVQVQRILRESGAQPACLKLELTESTVLENVEDTISKMRELKTSGMQFSMDDFGTGYSSLQYLKRLPLDQIKIDRSFVRDIATDPNDAAIVQTIIAMSAALGLEVIAEGVETEAQCEFLDRHGCHAFQGYLFSKPVELAQFEALLSQVVVQR